MYSSSATFKTALRQDHIVVSKAEIWNSDRKLQTLTIDTGKVTVDANSAIRRVCDVHLTVERNADNIVPESGFDNLTPFGNELRLYRGIQFEDSTIEYVPLGVFVMTEISIKDTNNGVSIAVKGEDRSLIISRAKWTQPYQMVQGSLQASLTAMLQNRWANVQTNFPTTNVTVEQIVFGTDNNNDAWADAVSLAALVGYDLYFDVNGIAVMTQFPAISTSNVVATYVEGSNTTITSIDRTLTSKETYNGVIYTIQGSQVTTPIRVEVWDEDTTSPTYRYGAFGQAPTFVTTSVLATQADAIKAATSLLNTYIGAQEQISWDSLVDPTLEANDVVYISTLGSKVSRLVIIDSIDIPLEPSGSMSAKARTVRILNASDEVTIGSI